VPLRKLRFLHTSFLENEAQINKNNYATILSRQKQVSVPKISSIQQKLKIGPKSDVRPFCTKFFNRFFVATCSSPMIAS